MNSVNTLILLGVVIYTGITLATAIADVEAKIDKLLKEKDEKE